MGNGGSRARHLANKAAARYGRAASGTAATKSAAARALPATEAPGLTHEGAMARRQELRAQISAAKAQGITDSAAVRHMQAEYRQLEDRLISAYNPNIVQPMDRYRSPAERTALTAERAIALDERKLREWNANAANFHEPAATGAGVAAGLSAESSRAREHWQANLPRVRAEAAAVKAEPIRLARPPRTTMTILTPEQATARFLEQYPIYKSAPKPSPASVRERARIEKLATKLGAEEKAAQLRANRMNSPEGMLAQREWRDLNADLRVLTMQLRATVSGSAEYRRTYEQYSQLHTQAKAVLARYHAIVNGKVKVGPPRTEPLGPNETPAPARTARRATTGTRRSTATGKSAATPRARTATATARAPRVRAQKASA